jgi:hypothetical protein
MQTTNIQNPALTSNLPTSITQVVATPSASTGRIVSSISFCNKSGGAVTVQVSLYNGTTDFYLAFNAIIAQGDTLVLGGGNLKLLLTNGFSLRALCNTSNAVDVIACYTDFT